MNYWGWHHPWIARTSGCTWPWREATFQTTHQTSCWQNSGWRGLIAVKKNIVSCMTDSKQTEPEFNWMIHQKQYTCHRTGRRREPWSSRLLQRFMPVKNHQAPFNDLKICLRHPIPPRTQRNLLASELIEPHMADVAKSHQGHFGPCCPKMEMWRVCRASMTTPNSASLLFIHVTSLQLILYVILHYFLHRLTNVIKLQQYN